MDESEPLLGGRFDPFKVANDDNLAELKLKAGTHT